MVASYAVAMTSGAKDDIDFLLSQASRVSSSLGQHRSPFDEVRASCILKPASISVFVAALTAPSPFLPPTCRSPRPTATCWKNSLRRSAPVPSTSAKCVRSSRDSTGRFMRRASLAHSSTSASHEPCALLRRLSPHPHSHNLRAGRVRWPSVLRSDYHT